MPSKTEHTVAVSKTSKKSSSKRVVGDTEPSKAITKKSSKKSSKSTDSAAPTNDSSRSNKSSSSTKTKKSATSKPKEAKPVDAHTNTSEPTVKKITPRDAAINEIIQNTDMDTIMRKLQSATETRGFSDSFSVKPEFLRVRSNEVGERSNTEVLQYRPFSDCIIKRIGARNHVKRVSIAARCKLRELAVYLLNQLMERNLKQLELCKRECISRQHAQASVEQVLGMPVLLDN